MLLEGGAMTTTNDQELVWNDDQSWAFPVLPVEDNGGKLLIDCGKIVTDADKPPANEEVAEEKKIGKRSASADEGKDGGEMDDHELHIWTERERRKKMRNMFDSLQALIPHLHPRADKSTTIDVAVEYIKHLQQFLEDLQNRKKQQLGKGNDANATAAAAVGPSREAFMADQVGQAVMPLNIAGPSNAEFKTWCLPNVVLSMCGVEAHFNIVCSPIKPGVLTALLLLMDGFNLDVVSAHVSSSGPTSRVFMVHVRANGIPQQFPEAEFVAEEAYKQVASELSIWINS